MCGIMGFIETGKKRQYTNESLRKVLVGLQSRGKHATGIALVNPNNGHNGVTVLKSSTPAEQFVKDELVLKCMTEKFKMFLGHTRLATSGTPKKWINNHPHLGDRYVLVHNGVVYGNTDDLQPLCKSECDSEYILRLIERDGIKKAFNFMIDRQSWDYAIIVIDLKTSTVYFTRNERPLFFYNGTDEIGGYMFASEEDIIKKNMVRIYEPKKIKKTRPYVLYSMKPGGKIEIEIDKHDEKTQENYYYNQYIGYKSSRYYNRYKSHKNAAKKQNALWINDVYERWAWDGYGH